MRTISVQEVVKCVRECCIEGATLLPADVFEALQKAEKNEKELAFPHVACYNDIGQNLLFLEISV